MDFNVLYLIKLLLSLAIVSLVVVIIIVIKKLGLYYTCFCKVDGKTEKHGGELVGDVLKAHGVKYIFTLVGGHISPILVASEKRDIRIIDTRHEVTAVFAADAVARLSGTVGVAAVTAGPGLTNTVTAVKNAQMAESPLLLIGGAAATLLKGRGALQDIDQMSLFKPLCKFTATIYHVRDIVPTLKEALQQAQSGTPGPVFVEFPIDTLYPYHMVKKEIGMKEDGPTSFMQRIINWYLNNHLNNLFADAWTPKDVTPLPVYIDFATDDKILELSQLLSKSKKPVILLGSQAVLPPTEVSTLRQALESLGVPCFLGGMSRGLLGRNNPIHIRQDRKQALKEADLVILAGSVCDFRLGYGRALNRRSKIVAINRNHEQLHKNSDMFWKPTLALQVDTGNTIVRLAKSLPGYKCDSDWCEKLKQREVAKEEANSVKAEKTTDVHLNPMKVLSQVDEVLDDDAILVADGGDFVATAAYILRPRGPLTWLDPGAFGTLGVGGGFALGAKLCRPDSDIWVIYGDGSLGYSIVEFDTYKRHKTPVIAVIGNDAGWTQIAREQVPMFGTDVACKLEYTAYDDVVKGFGAIGYKLDRSNQSDTLNILREAIQKSKENSVLINCMIGKTDFREGSISV